MAARLLSVPCSFRMQHVLWQQLIVNAGTLLKPKRSLLFTSYYLPSSRLYGTDHDPEQNPFRVQLLNPKLHDQLFKPQFVPTTVPEHVEVALQHLKDHALAVEKSAPLPSASFNLPPLVGNTIQEHFWNLGKDQIEPYYDIANKLTNTNFPPRPAKWHQKPGWLRYDTETNETSEVPYPLEESIIFDTEVMFKITHFPALATAVSAKAWYGWVSPDLVNRDSTFSSKSLIPLGPTAGSNANDDSGAQVVVGHHIGYDRARVADEYSMDAPRRAYVDTLSLHVASAGICSSQRPTWIRYEKGGIIDEQDVLFCQEGSMNSLAELSRFYLNETMSKKSREMFATTSIDDIYNNFENLMNYCANDVEMTARIYPKVLHAYFKKCPHPVSFAGIIQMGQSFIPVNRSWKRYIDKAETIFQDTWKNLEAKLSSLAEEALLLNEEERRQDPWLRHLDWTIPPLKMTTEKYHKDGTLKTPSVPYKRSAERLPAWYKGLLKDVNKEKRLKVGFKSRAAPYLLRLKWHGFPLYHSRSEGWCFRVGPEGPDENIPANAIAVDFAHDHGEEMEKADQDQQYEIPIMWYDKEATDTRPWDSYAAKDIEENKARYFRIPHKDGEKYRVGSPLAAHFITAYEDKILTSDFEFAKEILEANSSLAYWSSSRERIRQQFVVWEKDKKGMNSNGDHNNGFKVGKNLCSDANPDPYLAERREDEKDLGIILPQMITMATVTRRAVEQTWLTASNPNENRVGSELKSMVCSPPGYKIVGADVDSEELWICGVLGDAQFKSHGSTALGWMTLQGTKSAGTDMHSKTAKILGIDRSKAKVFNYSRMYGAGTEFASNALTQYNSAIGKKEADFRAKQLYEQTKGTRIKNLSTLLYPRLWFGGSESYTFNSIEYIANNNLRTPVLNCEITEALVPRVTRKFATSRHNWVVQSSGVDYLHLLLVAVNHISRRHGIKARFMISLHDEVRYLVAEEDSDRAALALQIANLWTRALFSARLGINNLPESVAFFSAVDVDHVMRKEVDIPCTTPSQPYPIPHGISLNIFQILERTENGCLGPVVQPDRPANSDIPATQSGTSKTVMQPVSLLLKAQRCQSLEDVGHAVASETSQIGRARPTAEQEEAKHALMNDGPYTDDPILLDMIDDSQVPPLDTRYHNRQGGKTMKKPKRKGRKKPNVLLAKTDAELEIALTTPYRQNPLRFSFDLVDLPNQTNQEKIPLS